MRTQDFGLAVNSSRAPWITSDVSIGSVQSRGRQAGNGSNTYYNADNVGIGTMAPTGKLTVDASTAVNTGQLRVQGSFNPSFVLVNSGIQAWGQWVDPIDGNKLKFGNVNTGIATGTSRVTVTQ